MQKKVEPVAVLVLATPGLIAQTPASDVPVVVTIGEGVVHAVPDDVWPITPANASDEELERVYGVLRSKHVVYGHIHQPFVRRLPTFTVVNSGAVSLSYDGDRRAAYALIDGEQVEIRRVEYDVEEEIRLLFSIDEPFATSTVETLRTGRYVPLLADSS